MEGRKIEVRISGGFEARVLSIGSSRLVGLLSYGGGLGSEVSFHHLKKEDLEVLRDVVLVALEGFSLPVPVGEEGG